MREEAPQLSPNREEPQPAVPLPPDFPEHVKVIPIPSLSIEEQRRAAQDEDESAIKRRHGGGLSDATHIG